MAERTMADPSDTPTPENGASAKIEAAQPAKTAKTAITERRLGPLFPILFTLATVFVLMLAQQNMAIFDGLDNSFTGSLFRWRGMDQGDERVVIVEIDDTSLRKLGSFPLPRSVYGQLLDKLFEAGVKVVALDVLFVEPSTPKEDRALIAASKKYRDKVVQSVMIDSEVEHENRILPPFKGLADVKPHVGLVTQAIIDDDAHLRQTALTIGKKNYAAGGEFEWADDPEALPSLGLAALALYEGKPFREYVKEVGVKLRVNYRGFEVQEIGTQIIEGQKHTMFAEKEGFHYIKLWKVLSGGLSQIDKTYLQDSIVMVGSTAVGYFDHFPNAFRENAAGLLVHATLIDNILQDRYLRKSSILYTHLMVLLFAFLSFGLLRLGPIKAAVIASSSIIIWALVCYQFFAQNIILRFWSPVFALIIPFVVLMVYKVMLEQQAKKEVRQMFGQYVSPEVVNILVKDPSKLQLGGQRRDMTIFFLDIAHFTSISEKMKPEELIQFLNLYLTELTDDILRNNGVVDKYIGDCIMAFWNAPLDEPDHRLKACLAAIDCQVTIKRLNAKYDGPALPETPTVRVGLNSGDVIVGNTGSARKLAYTVLGDEVNLSSRLEGANKFFGSKIMVSEDTYKGAAKGVDARVLGTVRVVGKDIPITVYELMARKGQLSKEWAEALPKYSEGVEKFLAEDFAAAKALFEAVLALVPDDKPSKRYLDLCNDYVNIPPQGDWKVFNLISK
jgi:adenylate cyclase